MARSKKTNANSLFTWLWFAVILASNPAGADQYAHESTGVSSYICVGSFRSEVKANNLSMSLNVAGYDVIVNSAVVNGASYHRVLIGPVPEDTEFQQEFMQWLATRGFRNTWVLRGVPEKPAGPPEQVKKQPAVQQAPIVKTPPRTEPQSRTRQASDYNPASLQTAQAPMLFNSTGDGTGTGLLARMPDLHFSGYAKSFAVIQDRLDNPLFSADTVYQSQNSLRLMLEAFGERAVWQLHYEVSPVMISRRFAFDIPSFNIVGDSYRLSDIEPSLSSEDSKTQVYQNLDRFNVQLQLDQGDLTIGRQAIAFGSARIINPTDVFLPFDVQTFNTEYRTGVDAIRFQRPMGELGELDVGIVLGDGADTETSAAFLQLRGNVNGKDLHFALIEYSRQTLVGAGLQTALGNFGFWLEAASVSGDEDFVRASLGLDYAFTEFTFGQVEYHYNGAGSDDPNDYIALASSHPYQRGGVFLFGEQYLIPSLSIQLSPLWVVSTMGILNLSDDSSFFSLSAAHNIAENFYMDYGIYLFTGEDLDISPLGVPVLGSEYGASPDMFYTSIRYYF